MLCTGFAVAINTYRSQRCGMRSNSLRNTVVPSVFFETGLVKERFAIGFPFIIDTREHFNKLRCYTSLPEVVTMLPKGVLHAPSESGAANHRQPSQPCQGRATKNALSRPISRDFGNTPPPPPPPSRFGYLKSKGSAPDSSVYYLLDSGRGTRLSIGRCLRCRSTQSKTESRVISVLPLRR